MLMICQESGIWVERGKEKRKKHRKREQGSGLDASSASLASMGMGMGERCFPFNMFHGVKCGSRSGGTSGGWHPPLIASATHTQLLPQQQFEVLLMDLTS